MGTQSCCDAAKSCNSALPQPNAIRKLSIDTKRRSKVERKLTLQGLDLLFKVDIEVVDLTYSARSKPAFHGQVYEKVGNKEKKLSTYRPSLPRAGLSRISLPVCDAQKATSGTRQFAGHVQPE